MHQSGDVGVVVRPKIRLAQHSGQWKVRIEYPPLKNPYEHAAGVSIGELPDFIARQYGAYPNPHLLAVLAIGDSVFCSKPCEAVLLQRFYTGQAIIVRDLALHLATCLLSADVPYLGDHEHVEELREVAHSARKLEICLAGTLQKPKLFFGDVTAPDETELKFRTESLARQIRNVQYVIAQLVGKACGSEAAAVLLTSATRLLSAMRLASFADQISKIPAYPVVSFDPKSGVHIVVLDAPRGSLMHVVAIDRRLMLVTNGSAIVPTTTNMNQFEVHASAAVNRELNQGVKRLWAGSRLARLARAYNPCGLDLNGDFIDVVWED